MTKLYAMMTDPQNGWNHDKQMAEKYLDRIKGRVYIAVELVEIGRSSTDVHLPITIEGRKHTWNSVQFTFYIRGEDNKMEEYDIFKDPLHLSNIYHTYKNLW